jgi:hypothetical protein
MARVLVLHTSYDGSIPSPGTKFRQGESMEEDIVFRLRKRAEIRRQISTRKSVQEGKPDRIADLLEEAANEIERLRLVSKD